MVSTKACDGGGVDYQEVDSVFEALANPIRRGVMSTVIGRETPMPIKEVLDIVTFSEYLEISEEDTYRLLRHRHLPILEKHRLIKFNNETDQIVNNSSQLTARLLSMVDEPWTENIGKTE